MEFSFFIISDLGIHEFRRPIPHQSSRAGTLKMSSEDAFVCIYTPDERRPVFFTDAGSAAVPQKVTKQNELSRLSSPRAATRRLHPISGISKGKKRSDVSSEMVSLPCRLRKVESG